MAKTKENRSRKKKHMGLEQRNEKYMNEIKKSMLRAVKNLERHKSSQRHHCSLAGASKPVTVEPLYRTANAQHFGKYAPSYNITIPSK
jgi:hypothetical protein